LIDGLLGEFSSVQVEIELDDRDLRIDMNLQLVEEGAITHGIIKRHPFPIE
jgi:hypothetical protein